MSRTVREVGVIYEAVRKAYYPNFKIGLRFIKIWNPATHVVRLQLEADGKNHAYITIYDDKITISTAYGSVEQDLFLKTDSTDELIKRLREYF